MNDVLLLFDYIYTINALDSFHIEFCFESSTLSQEVEEKVLDAIYMMVMNF